MSYGFLFSLVQCGSIRHQTAPEWNGFSQSEVRAKAAVSSLPSFETKPHELAAHLVFSPQDCSLGGENQFTQLFGSFHPDGLLEMHDRFWPVALTWGPYRIRDYVSRRIGITEKLWPLVAGIVFHLGIILLFNLASFAIAMIAAMILYLRPADGPFEPSGSKKPRLTYETLRRG